MADAIATVEELQARLDWVLDSGEQGVAAGALDDLSDDARYYGSASWSSTTAPRQVKSLVLRAAARYMRNPDGYVTSRAGDETLAWSDLGEDAGTAHFTSTEQKMLAKLAGRSKSIVSVNTVAYGPTRSSGPRYINPYVPLDRSDDTIYAQADSGLFPMLAKDEF